jgi:sortase A
MMVKVILEPRRKRTGRRVALSLLRAVFLLVAVISLGYYGYVTLHAKVYQAYEEYWFDQQSRGLAASWPGFVRFEADRLVGADSGSESAHARPAPSPAQPAAPAVEPAPARRLARDAVIGRIEIPRLHVRAIVREGDDAKTLSMAVGHIPGTALPGAAGNVALAAHRDTFFRALKDVRKNDRIELRTLDGDYEYVVQSTHIVSPSDVAVLKPSKDPRLTLVTCYPFYFIGHAPRRFVVEARQVTTEASVAGPASIAQNATP